MIFFDIPYGHFGFWTKTYWVCLKAPWNPQLFSERYGYEIPRLSLFGWRLFARPIRKVR